MDVFNIKINIPEKEITLTILPIDAHTYKIIYDGGIIGGIKLTESKYDFIQPDQLAPGDLPLYNYKQGESIEEAFLVNKVILQEIAEEINKMI